MTIQHRAIAHPTDEAAQSPTPPHGQISQQRSPSPTSDGQPHNASLETTPAPYGQVLQQRFGSPTLIPQTCPDNPITPINGADYDYIHHILIGSPQGVTDAINRLHPGHRIERHRWTPLIAVREAGIHITPAQGQVISYLIQQRSTAQQ
ncbi:MAG: hypothetical protein AAF289_20215 [Cyanobacteria bacterium P01_A01_bin.135]